MQVVFVSFGACSESRVLVECITDKRDGVSPLRINKAVAMEAGLEFGLPSTRGRIGVPDAIPVYIEGS